MTKLSPLAPKRIQSLLPVDGFRIATGGTAIRYKDRDDLLLVEMDEGTVAAGVFTQSSTRAAPVLWCEWALKSGSARALVVNSGNANAFTGSQGDVAVSETVRAVVEMLHCGDEQVYISSTGVIGQPLQVEKIVSMLPEMGMHLKTDAWLAAADAIRTTDTFPKVAMRRVLVGETMVTINGIAKGSGMIAPNMATMLGYIFTDAAISQKALQEIVRESNEVSFNSITVDGDTSTNDTLLAFASGKAGNEMIEDIDTALATAFCTGFQEVMCELAQQIVRDGEGATKFIRVRVQGAATNESARKIALSIANSPLVKTAIAGEDPNWGRIVMAVGKTDEPIDVSQLAVSIGAYPITQGNGLVAGYDEKPVAEYMKGEDIEISVKVGLGRGSSTVWTCDLTHDYITINAHYRS